MDVHSSPPFINIRAKVNGKLKKPKTRRNTPTLTCGKEQAQFSKLQEYRDKTTHLACPPGSCQDLKVPDSLRQPQGGQLYSQKLHSSLQNSECMCYIRLHYASEYPTSRCIMEIKLQKCTPCKLCCH